MEHSKSENISAKINSSHPGNLLKTENIKSTYNHSLRIFLTLLTP